MYKVISVEYFMDSLQEWEVIELYNNLKFNDSPHWEQTRLLLSCHVDHKRVKRLQDIIQFAWDEKEDNSYDELSLEEKQRRRKIQREMLKNITQQNNG